MTSADLLKVISDHQNAYVLILYSNAHDHFGRASYSSFDIQNEDVDVQEILVATTLYLK